MQLPSSNLFALAALLNHVAGHGVLTSITGANGVTMPGLSVIDGTPRDCATPRCGSEADTSIIRRTGSPLGRTQGGGQVDAATAVAKFMGGNAAASTGATSAKASKNKKQQQRRGLLDRLTGNSAAGAGSTGSKASGIKTTKGTVESGVSAAAGSGSTSGLPTADADGVVTLTYHQVNQDGAGPLTADIDPSSGGTDASAFQRAKILQDVPGLGVGGLSGTTTTDFTVKVQMPAGMTCSGSVGGASGVCVVRVKNSALAGPFGGSAAFTDGGDAGNATAAAAEKRAVSFAA